jgi:hypothetical protein
MRIALLLITGITVLYMIMRPREISEEMLEEVVEVAVEEAAAER